MPKRAGSRPWCDTRSRVSNLRTGSASRGEAPEVNVLRMPENRAGRQSMGRDGKTEQILESPGISV